LRRHLPNRKTEGSSTGEVDVGPVDFSCHFGHLIEFFADYGAVKLSLLRALGSGTRDLSDYPRCLTRQNGKNLLYFENFAALQKNYEGWY
jgi:hypothetical protein